MLKSSYRTQEDNHNKHVFLVQILKINLVEFRLLMTSLYS
jgi:hypothetical protein